MCYREFIVKQSKSTVLGTFLNQNSLIYRYRFKVAGMNITLNYSLHDIR